MVELDNLRICCGWIQESNENLQPRERMLIGLRASPLLIVFALCLAVEGSKLLATNSVT